MQIPRTGGLPTIAETAMLCSTIAVVVVHSEMPSDRSSEWPLACGASG